jgi:hypothetical protein
MLRNQKIIPAYAPREERNLRRDFFHKQLTSAKEMPRRASLSVKSGAKLVKTAYLLRNEETGNQEISAKIKYPAARLVADMVSNVTTPLAIILFAQIPELGKTAQAIIGAVSGDMIGTLVGLAPPWLLFNIGIYRKKGYSNFFKEYATLSARILAGLAIDSEKKLNGLASQGVKITPLKRWAHRIVGTLLSPLPVVYSALSLSIAIAGAAGADPRVFAAFAGLFTIPVLLPYAIWINRKVLSDIDESFKKSKEFKEPE